MHRIPHTIRMYETWHMPMVTLHVVTDLPQHRSTPGYDPVKNKELHKAAHALVHVEGAYDRFIVHAPDQP